MHPRSLLPAGPPSASPLERVKHRLDVFETAVRLTVSIELSFLRQRGLLPVAARKLLVQSLGRPSLGQWIGYHRAAQAALTAAGWPCDDWIGPVEDRHQVVRVRNTFAHGGAGRLATDRAASAALDAAGTAIDGAAVLGDSVIRIGPAVGDGLHECLVDLPDSAGTVEASPLLWWRDGLLIYHSVTAGRRAASPEYTTVDAETAVRLPGCAAVLDTRFPLARWRNPVVDPLGAAGQDPGPPVGRGAERAEVAGFLRTGKGILIVDAEAGAGKTSLLRGVLDDLRGTSPDAPALPAVPAEPVAVGYFIRRGTRAAFPSVFLDALLEAISTAYRLGPPAPALTDAARVEQLALTLARIENDDTYPPLAIVVDALDESPPIAAYLPVGGDRVRVVASTRAGTDVVPNAPWRAAVTTTLPLRGLTREAVRTLVPAGEATVDRLLAASGGNPLYLRFAVTAGLTEDPPASLERLFDAVLGRLPAPAGAVLRLLAEIPESMPVTTIETLTGCPAPRLRPVLDPAANPFVQADLGSPGCWSLSHDLAGQHLRGSGHGTAVPARLRAHLLRPGSYRGPAAGPLVRYGVPLLLSPGHGWDTGAAAERLATLLTGDGMLDGRLDHQDPVRLLTDLEEVYAAAPGQADRLTDTVAVFVLRHASGRTGRVLPEHLQSAYLTGSLDRLYPALLARLCDEGWVAERVTGPAELPILAFRYAQANLDRRTLDPRRLAAAREMLGGSLRRLPPELDEAYAREKARIHYDLGYLGYLDGQYDEALAHFATSADAAAEGGDEVGTWVAHALTAQFLFQSRRVPAWLAQAGLRRVAERLAAMPADSPHAARWLRTVHESGFNIAFRARRADDAGDWYDALQDDVRIRHLMGVTASTLTQARWLMLHDRWSDATELLEPVLPAALRRWTEGAAREVLDLGVARWHTGDRAGARTAWDHAAAAPDGTANHTWREVARRLLQDQPDDPWGW
ncbi:hypothetical protein [Actinoplanes sp. NPDC020271]|uniref:hypothetical protein n=1 Tax=Actinoplanes sp. NPDC020271 TaxID=3363896 RepID=UPI00379B47F0